jgi:hypothetical protein
VGVIWEERKKIKKRGEREGERTDKYVPQKFTKKTLTSDMFPSYRFSVPHHLLQVGLIVRTAVNTTKDEN